MVRDAHVNSDDQLVHADRGVMVAGCDAD